MQNQWRNDHERFWYERQFIDSGLEVNVHCVNKIVLEFSDISGDIIEICPPDPQDIVLVAAFVSSRGPMRKEERERKI